MTEFNIVPGVRKIAILRANGIGDYIFTLPALEALRGAYPGAEVVLLGRPWHASFLAGRPGPVDRVVVTPPSRGVRFEPGMRESPDEVDAFFERMAGERFDLALQLHGGGVHSNPFVLRLGAGLTAGLRTPDAVPLDRWVPYLYWQHEVLRFLEVVGLVGAGARGLEPRMEPTPADLDEARPFAPADGPGLVVLHPGAGDPRRRWPVEKFATVGDALAGDGHPVAVVSAGNESGLAGQVTARMKRPALALGGALSLGGLAGLLSCAALVISNDSGPLHLAAAVGARTVGIYWCGNFINAAPIGRARHRPLLNWRLECPVCGANCITGRCEHDASFVADVETEAVIGNALDLLQTEVRPRDRDSSSLGGDVS